MDLYYTALSPPCWSVILLSRQLNFPLNLKSIDTTAGEHKTEHFLKINPTHTLPALAVDEYAISESRAIMIYLIESQTDGNHPLYPKDVKTRGLIHNRLDFDLGTFYKRAIDYCMPLFRIGSLGPEENAAKLDEALGFLEAFLSKTQYVAANHLTIADISLVATVTTLDICYFDRSKYNKVAAWYDTCKKELIGYEDVIADSAAGWRKLFKKPESEAK
ncbi:glutathione S-transferase 2-like [Armigeres subalbatus]|uniref:glutathione S-transferase 2-like n=1 Tax=Armigeres subalbatus TaxID=124917 RepID=UPI002ED11ADE